MDCDERAIGAAEREGCKRGHGRSIGNVAGDEMRWYDRREVRLAETTERHGARAAGALAFEQRSEKQHTRTGRDESAVAGPTMAAFPATEHDEEPRQCWPPWRTRAASDGQRSEALIEQYTTRGASARTC